MKRTLAGLTAFLLSTSSLQSATLLPNGQQQFVDGNGKPYASGKVYFYSNFPTCSVLKNTWSNSGQTVLNTNPVTLDSAGRATIFGSGTYCQVLKDSSNNTIWTKETGDATSTSNLGWGSTSGGTANAQTVTVTGFANTNGQTFYFVAGATNTSALTLSVNGGTPLSVVKDTPSGSQLLLGGEVVAGNVVGVTYVSVSGNLHLITNNNITPPGQIGTYASSSCPTGWLAANGAAVSATTYSALFAAIGSAWNVGGEGTGNFRIPDLRGMFVRGTGTNGTGSSTGAAGPTVGAYQADTYLNHSHAVTDPGHTHPYTYTTTVSGGSGFGAVGTSYSTSTLSGTTTSNTTGLTVNTSTTGGTETKPKNYGVLYCIKY